MLYHLNYLVTVLTALIVIELVRSPGHSGSIVRYLSFIATYVTASVTGIVVNVSLIFYYRLTLGTRSRVIAVVLRPAVAYVRRNSHRSAHVAGGIAVIGIFMTLCGDNNKV